MTSTNRKKENVGNSQWVQKYFKIVEVNSSHCSRITRYPSFISQDFFHFSSFIHDGDNLNMYKYLNIHGEF